MAARRRLGALGAAAAAVAVLSAAGPRAGAPSATGLVDAPPGGGAVPLSMSGARTVPDGAGKSHAEGPPPGHTGGFGEPSCLACHTEFDVNVGGSLTLEGLPSTYEPGATYVVSVVLRSTDMAGAGFQAAARLAGTGAADAAGGGGAEVGQAGTLESLDARTAVIPDSTGTIQYVQHVTGSTKVDDPERATWSFEWTAPERAADAVLFHAAANSANGDDSPLGDLVYTTERRLEAADTPGSPTTASRKR